MRTVLFAAFAAVAAACTPAAEAPDLRPLAEGEARIDGVAQVEDGGYPQFTVTVQPESGEPLALYLNAEGGADLGGQEPSSFSGQTVTAYYATSEDLLLLDVAAAGTRAAAPADGTPAPQPDDQTITGVLSGADAVTNSDLPGGVTITDAQGAVHSFEHYVTPDLVALNGQQVTARYRPGERREITLLRSVEGGAR